MSDFDEIDYRKLSCIKCGCDMGWTHILTADAGTMCSDCYYDAKNESIEEADDD